MPTMAAATTARSNMAKAPLKRFADDLSEAVSAAPRTSREIRAPVYVQVLTSDKSAFVDARRTAGSASRPVAPCGRAGLACHLMFPLRYRHSAAAPYR